MRVKERWLDLLLAHMEWLEDVFLLGVVWLTFCKQWASHMFFVAAAGTM